MKKYYNFETRFTSLKDDLTNYLKENNIYYELSGALANYHFEILLNETEANQVNSFLDSCCIWEVR